MFVNDNLKSYLENSPVVEASPLIVAEINMNSADRIAKIGNYRYRPNDIGSDYHSIATTYDSTDADNNYTGATDSDALIDGGTDENDNPIAYSSIQTNKQLYYSLEDCFGKFRPRSGINKAMWFGGQPGKYVGYDNSSMMRRPRYYMASKDDKFKYWTSMRTENGIEYGVSALDKSITDTAPFVVYNEKIPTNRIILKMQTNVGDVDLGPFTRSNLSGTFEDPFYDATDELVNRTVPTIWRVEYLDATNTWNTLLDFGSEIFDVPRDGYVEIGYSGGNWTIGEESITDSTAFMKDFISPVEIDTDKYEEFQYIYGLRVVVDEMSKSDAAFDLIELSPRLAIDLTEITTDFRISKIASDLGVSGMPVGQLLASTGSITIADYEDAFNALNADSVIANFIGKNIQIKFYEIITDATTNYYVPVKTLYAQSFPTFNVNERTASIDLRDMYTYFESVTAPQILLKNVSFSYAIAMLLDSVGFTNYIYYRVDGEDDPIIPFFFISPEKTVAEVLADLAISTQTAMFFDEYNNLVLMSKNYIMPALGERSTNVDLVLYGTKDFEKRNELAGYHDGTTPLANIIDIAAKDNTVFNGGTITYSARYIQKSYQNIKQASLVDRDKTWIYKPVLLWEVAGEETTKSVNEDDAKQSSFTLSAIPLNSDLSKDVPYVDANGDVKNNILDLGDGVYWMGRYNGYFYSGSEIIRFDAVEYNISQEKVVAADVQAISVNGTSNLIIEDDTVTSSLLEGQKIVQTGAYSRSLSGKKISATLSGTDTLTLSSADNAQDLFIGQNLTKISDPDLTFKNIKFAYPNYVILDKDDDKAITENLYLDCSVSAGDTVPYRTTREYIFKLTKNHNDIVVTSAEKNAYNVALPDLTPKQLGEMMQEELDSVNSGELRKIEPATSDNAEAKLYLDALPQSPKVKTVYYDARKSTLTISLKDKARKTATVKVRIVSIPIQLPSGARIASFMGSGKVKLDGKEYQGNKVFTIDKTFSKTGTNVFEKTLVVGPTQGVFGSGPTIIEKLSDTSYKLDVNHASTGYVVFNGTDLQEGELNDNIASTPLRIQSIDKTSSKKMTMSLPPTISGGVVFDVKIPSGNVWISSVEEYQSYFSKIPFGGKLYPTGRVRIYSEPFIDENGHRVPGAVSKHGRGQFGTTIQSHTAGLAKHWSDDNNVAGCFMESRELFSQVEQTSFVIDTIVQSDGYSSNGVNIYVGNVENIVKGQLVTEDDPGPTAKLQADTKVVSVPSDANGTPTGYMVVDKAPTTRLQGDDLVVSSTKPMRQIGTTNIVHDDIEETLKRVSVSAYPSAKSYAQKTTRNGIMRNFLSSSYFSDTGANKLYSTQTGTIQSSALIMNGRDFPDSSVIKPLDFLSMVTKDLSTEIGGMSTHVGTRVRIVGRVGNDTDSQRPAGATTYFAASTANADTPTIVEGGSAGLGIMINDNGNLTGITSGYFYEIIALDTNNVSKFSNDENLANVVFYKVESPEIYRVVKSVKVTKAGKKYKAIYTLDDTGNSVGGKMKLRKKMGVIISENGTSSVPATLRFAKEDLKTIKSIGNTSKNVTTISINLGTSLPSGVTLNTTYTFANGKVEIPGKRKAIPRPMWSGFAPILVDDGLFTGQYRISGQENQTVYDLAVEYQENYEGGTKFLLYLNNKVIGSVVDPEPLPKKNKVAMFVRGSTRAMFEKIYAIQPNSEGDTINPADTPLSGFTNFEKQMDSAFSSYKNPEQVSRSYLEAVSPIKSPKNNMYLDEFGSIMREAHYFNVKYDKAYPAFYATLAPTFNKLQGYAIAGFTAGAYGAEFLIFNTTDTVVTLDSETGNYLRILGVTFTQQSDHQLTVDEFFKQNSDFSQTELAGSDLVLAKQQYQDLKSSRITYGLNEFNINAPYIQSQDAANALMKWMTSKIMKPRKSVGLNIFPNPTIQLGDIVTIDYSVDGSDQIVDSASRFVVYNIDYSRSADGPGMTIYLSEVK
jgi:hypothetical protein